MTKQILLVCGAGASSGFMAAAARKAAKKNGVDLEIKAKSESELNDYLDATDLLLVAPHLKYMIEEVKDSCQQKGVKYGIIPQKVYGALDGKGLVAFAEELLEEGN
ncbi:PTS sugar transporter subunit IIB [Enterococcus faecalis]